MTQTENTTESRKGKHLDREERNKIEAWKQLDAPLPNRQIAKKLDRSHQTINTEIKDGTVRQIKRQIQSGKAYDYEYFSYSAAAGQSAYEKARESSRKKPKWVDAPDFMAYADQQMKQEKRSPDVVVHHAKKNNLFPHESIPCTTTLYNYIDDCLMETRNIDLCLKTRRSTKASRNRKNKTILGELIEKRPEIVDKRERFGDWEIDTVNGLRCGKDEALLTLTERKTRYEMILKIDGKTSDSVNRALTTLQEAAGKNFSQLFKTITSDNGVEFSGLTELLQGITDVYFTHPYSSWERGTNENHNGIIRRFIPKGTRIADVSLRTIQRVQNWMNNLPRKILNYATPRERLLEELSHLALSE
ncbi:IS30 family transposase [Enterococcus sp. AZ007]|uniref:IS30 family transposase n=1 Tax=Enterococcus sp. AZ007 TaxID=2774839 RepID=UPI003F254860